MSQTKEKIKQFYELHEKILFQKKKNISRLIPNEAEAIVTIEQWLNTWKIHLEYVKDIVKDATIEDFQSQTEKLELLVTSALEIVTLYQVVKEAILLPEFEDIQNDMIKGINSLVKPIDELFRLNEPIAAKIADPSTLLAINIAEINSNYLVFGRCARLVRQKKLKQDRTATFSKNSKLFHHTLSLRVQFLLFLVLLSSSLWLEQETLVALKLLMKPIILSIMVMWFPTQFVPAMFRDYRITSWILGAVLWSVGLSIWVYGLITGIVVGGFLVLYPFSNLFNLSRNARQDKLPNYVKSAYRRLTVALLIIGLLLHENVWIVGSVAWWVFTYISQLSFTHFRSTFDMVDSMDPERKSADIKRNMVFITLASTLIAVGLFSILAGELTSEFVQNLYTQAATISFGVVAILFAVQSIIPGITSWGGAELQNRTPSQIREMKLLLSTSKGLMGFLQVYFLLFIVALLGFSVSSLVPAGANTVNLNPSYLILPQPNLLDFILENSDFQYSSETTLVFLQTLLFVGFVCLFAYSLSVLYYLFIATNTLTLPIRDALLSKPVHIPQFSDKGNTDIVLYEKLKTKLENAKTLRGEYITDLHAFFNQDNVGGAIVQISGDFDSTAQVINKAFSLLQAAFNVNELQNVTIVVVKAWFGPSERQKLLTVTVTRNEYKNFLSAKVKGMDLDYKVKQLGAEIAHHLLPEAQIM